MVTGNNEMTKLTQWVLGIVTTLGTLAVAWTGAECRAMRLEITEIKAELGFATPREVLSAVNNLSSKLISEQRVVQLIENHAPWLKERRDWETWRLRIDSRLDRIDPESNINGN